MNGNEFQEADYANQMHRRATVRRKIAIMSQDFRSFDPSSTPPKRRGGWAVVMTSLGVSGFVLACISLVWPGFVFAVAALVAFCMLQYLVWGWWLQLVIPRETVVPHDD